MILHGNARGGSKDLALHLLKDENDHVTIHELRGFISDNLVSALNEVYAVSRGTKAKQYLFSLSLNPPANENVSTAVFEEAIERVEKELGLTGQPRAVVFHEKNSRRHCHTVWSRIDGQSMKAIPLPFSKRKLTNLSRDLYFEHGWQMPDGFLRKADRDPNNFTLAQWQQAKRTGQNPKELKAQLKSYWAASRNLQALQSHLQAQGFTLAQGNRRAYVVIDQYCEIYSLSRWLGLRTKEVKAKLGEAPELPLADQAKIAMAKRMEQRLSEIYAQRSKVMDTRMEKLAHKKAELKARHQSERKNLLVRQEQRTQAEVAIRQERFRKGIIGLWDRLNGKHRRIKQQNEREAELAFLRDQKERDEQVFQQLAETRKLHERTEVRRTLSQQRTDMLSRDIEQYKEIQREERDVFKFRDEVPERER